MRQFATTNDHIINDFQQEVHHAITAFKPGALKHAISRMKQHARMADAHIDHSHLDANHAATEHHSINVARNDKDLKLHMTKMFGEEAWQKCTEHCQSKCCKGKCQMVKDAKQLGHPEETTRGDTLPEDTINQNSVHFAKTDEALKEHAEVYKLELMDF